MDNTLDSNLSLPKNADPTGAVQDIESTQQQDSTELFTISQLSEKTTEQTELPSPRSRKRHSDEVYQKVDKPVTTTPQKTPPRKSIANFRQQSFDLSHASHGSVGAASSNLRTVLNMQSSPSTALPPSNQETQSTQRTTASQTTTFVDELNTYQRDLDNQYERFASELERRDRQADLEDYDWDALETRYRNEVKPLLEDEDRIKKELGQRLQQFLLWMQVSGEKESERAIKRLRTRSAFVKTSEAQLEQKQQHYAKVLNAFQTAMSLLNT